MILRTETDAKSFTQKIYNRQILYGELAQIAKLSKMGKGRADLTRIEVSPRAHGKKGKDGLLLFIQSICLSGVQIEAN